MKFFISLSIVLFNTFSSQSQSLIQIKDAASHIGDSVVIHGTVFSAQKNTATRFVIGTIASQTIEVMIKNENRPKFSFTDQNALINKEVRIRGVIQLINGKPVIDVTNDQQFQIILSGDF